MLFPELVLKTSVFLFASNSISSPVNDYALVYACVRTFADRIMAMRASI
jgi:hypothetical protein